MPSTKAIKKSVEVLTKKLTGYKCSIVAIGASGCCEYGSNGEVELTIEDDNENVYSYTFLANGYGNCSTRRIYGGDSWSNMKSAFIIQFEKDTTIKQ